MQSTSKRPPENSGILDKIIWFCLTNKPVVLFVVIFLIIWGYMVAPFDFKSDWLPRDPVPVDAIPDVGENQQIVFTEWGGRSPQDVEDQVTYPLTVSLLGIPGISLFFEHGKHRLVNKRCVFRRFRLFPFFWFPVQMLYSLNHHGFKIRYYICMGAKLCEAQMIWDKMVYCQIAGFLQKFHYQFFCKVFVPVRLHVSDQLESL